MNGILQHAKSNLPKFILDRSEITYMSEVYQNLINDSGCRFYYLDTTKTRLISINYIDTINYEIRGCFEFTAINKCQDTVHITNGYFDVEYRF